MSPKESNPLLPISALRSSPAASSFEAEASASAASLKKHVEPPHKLLGIACVAASAVCFSLMSTFLKYNTFSMTSMEAIFWRSLVALALNYAFIAHKNEKLYVKPEDRMMMLYRVIAGFSSISFAFYAVSQMVLADASVIIFTSPVITFFFGACFLGEKIDLPSFFFAVLSFAGLICVVRPGFIFGYDHATAQTDGTWIAIGSALLGAVGQAFVFISVRKLQGISAFVVVHYFMLFSIVMSLLWIAVFQREFVIPNTWSLWMSVVGSGVFTGIGQMLLTKGFQLEKAGIASVMRYLDVVCVFIWDAVLLGEHINHWSVVGAIIICSCAVVTAVRKSKAAQE
ncbi:Drug/metabolite transporter [Globisporangium polare]